MSGYINELIDSINSEIVVSHNTPENFFAVKENEKYNTFSVWITEPLTKMARKLAFKYIGTKKGGTLIVKKNIVNEISIPGSVEVGEIKSDKLNSHLRFTVFDEDITSLIKEIAVYYVEHFEPSDKFGCCSKYKECSEAKKCLHNNLFYSKACWYRKSLESGKIFF